ncbi:MAG: DUF86 domain-containing protein [Halanaerobiales bacterium]|nr:DUF86 domain-containing protein [Halanaerobiales bacterium]
MVIDRGKVESRIYYIKQNLEKLYKLRGLAQQDFLRDYRNHDAAKYNLQVIIEALIDIGNHIISRKKLPIPDSNADTFRILSQNGIIPVEKLSRYEAMAKFRNMVVHLYQDINEEEIFHIIKNDLSDIEYFIEIIAKKYL